MTYDKAVNIIALQIQAMQGNTDSAPSVDTMQQALQALKRFDGAVEVHIFANGEPQECDIEITDFDMNEVSQENHRFYAIPKENK